MRMVAPSEPKIHFSHERLACMLLIDLTYLLAHVQHVRVFTVRKKRFTLDPTSAIACLGAMNADIVSFFPRKEMVGL